ncbi:MAG: hypothetical protein HON98_13615 [Chloroflexi bacterium]|jgi:hypothetical protein|nr:hypothetical protein [Chloroflexota bacterium]MBT3671103.1 hypothetical protein [Chloroflexota bacterium]MBT4003317.1 hypothetical protein [Chloroflexota bacterium]MBT4304918.1 hypothetical protein [Chloroflexota bacterium]MBT4533994.1 hypothetical protein [Chloroflexota bacterium]
METNLPSHEILVETLNAAWAAHKEFENGFLNGVRDEQWSTWFTGYVLGRLGDFVSPSSLVVWLESIDAEEGWSEAAASLVLNELMK